MATFCRFGHFFFVQSVCRFWEYFLDHFFLQSGVFVAFFFAGFIVVLHCGNIVVLEGFGMLWSLVCRVFVGFWTGHCRFIVILSGFVVIL